MTNQNNFFFQDTLKEKFISNLYHNSLQNLSMEMIQLINNKVKQQQLYIQNVLYSIYYHGNYYYNHLQINFKETLYIHSEVIDINEDKECIKNINQILENLNNIIVEKSTIESYINNVLLEANYIVDVYKLIPESFHKLIIFENDLLFINKKTININKKIEFDKKYHNIYLQIKERMLINLITYT